MIFSMEVQSEEPKQAVEPRFLTQAVASGIRLRIGQTNKTEYEGVLREIGRYDINLDINGRIITLLKQEISYLTAPETLLAAPPHQPPQNVPAQPAAETEGPASRPNIQQEFLDKAIRENQMLTLYLISGQRLKGHIQEYDNFTILIRENDRQHLFYKHAITTINR